ncbi:PBS lyase [Streptomyces glaucosporus]|uniref:PBS lyase n=1 Tax=Streptomyces glaucosporus TaxID=284044 RepID=UPI0031E1EA5D
MGDVLKGLDEVDWASMVHAYGDASDVPRLLRGLASEDAAEREIALDGMYGAVHHQGDVYDSTVACVPFLFELVRTEGLPGRADLVELLCGIDGDGRDLDELEALDEYGEEHEKWIAWYASAEREVRARGGLLLDLVDDPDPALRAALPRALVQLHGEPGEVLRLLRHRLAVERDGAVLRSLVAALGELGRRHEQCADEACDALEALTGGRGCAEPDGTGVRLAALVQLARCAPHRLPEGTVGIAVDEMRTARGTPPREERPAEAPPRTPTMIAYLRALESAHRPPARSRWATELLEDLHRALDDRIAGRFALLEDQLRSPDREQRRAAIDMAGLLLTGWRGPHETPVRLLGERLHEADPGLRHMAAAELIWLHPIGGPAVGDLAERVASGPGFPPQSRWTETSWGAAVCALAAQGDARAVPALRETLRHGRVPEELPEWVGRLGPASAPLVPVLCRRLDAGDPWEHPWTWERLAGAAAATGALECLPPLLRVLRGAGERGPRLLGPALDAVAALGPEAAAEALSAVPLIRRLVDDAPSAGRYGAVAVVAAAEGATPGVLAALADGLASDRWLPRHEALSVAARLGRAAAGVLPRIRELAASREAAGGWAGGPLLTALWRVGGDAEETLRCAARVWEGDVTNRPDVAAVLAVLGRAGAETWEPLLRAELASPRRHGNTGGGGRMRCRVDTDERLLRDCRRALRNYAAGR